MTDNSISACGAALLAPCTPRRSSARQRWACCTARSRNASASARPRPATSRLLWPDDNTACPNCELDFPEGNWNSGIDAYAHHLNSIDGNQVAYSAGTTFTSWHTSDIVCTPGSVIELDGRVVGHSTTAVPNTAMSWIIQNETALEGPAPAPNSSAQMDVTYVKGWSYS